MLAPVVIPGDVVVARFIDLGVHVLEVVCIAILTWLVKVGRREFLEAVDHRAGKASAVAIAPLEARMNQLNNQFRDHEDLDQGRHDEVMLHLRTHLQL